MSKIYKWTQLAKAKMHPEEKLIVTVIGSYETKLLGHDSVRTALMIATNKGIIFYTKRWFGNYEMERIPYEKITSVSTGRSMGMELITIQASGSQIKLKHIHDGQYTGVMKALNDHTK